MGKIVTKSSIKKFRRGDDMIEVMYDDKFDPDKN